MDAALDQNQASQTDEVTPEADQAVEEDLVASMEEQVDQESTSEPAPVDNAAVGNAAEAGGTAPALNAAPTQISGAKATEKTNAYNAKEKKRTDEQKKRMDERAARSKKPGFIKRIKEGLGIEEKTGDWTLSDLTELIKKSGAESVFPALDRRSPAQGIQLLKDNAKWDPLIAALPKGKLAAGTRAAIGHLVMDGVLSIDDCKTLFEKRFGHAARDVGKQWTLGVMQVLWRQLDLLPESDVALNTAITTFDAIAGGGGFGPSWEAPATINTIQLGVDTTDYQHLEHTVRHEVAHGVHTQIPGPVNDWLQKDMQFWFIDFDTFIADLGGLPIKYTPPSEGAERPCTPDEKAWIKDIIQNQWTGNASWGPTPGVTIGAWLASNPDWLALWNAAPAKLRNACDQSVTNWYQNYENFQESGGKRYFLNHWYHRPFTIGAEAMKAIPTTNDNYTAMSEKEFFANCYAEYFEDPEGAKDNSKWGGGLSSGIKDFFKSCILQRNPYAKFKKDQKDAQKDAQGGDQPKK